MNDGLMTIRLPQDLKDQLKAEAKQANQTLGEYIRSLLTDG